ncbi:MAG: ankyrin repeat domain-containing protein [Gammaproteobacteria bacterium]|nr:ankyrin repeat domain-containing protein [Gammaproteobacteria bacterium]
MVDNIIEVLNGCLSQIVGAKAADSDKVGIIRRLISKSIEYIGTDVIFDGEQVTLMWCHVIPYLSTHTPEGDHLYSHITTIFSANSVRHFGSGDLVCKVVFKEQCDYSSAFFDFLNHILPLQETTYPQLFFDEVLLTTEQYFFWNQYTMDSTGKLSSWCIEDSLLKTLRADEFDFSYQFILGIIPGENESRRLHNLRPNNRQPYTITPEGCVIPRVHKKPLYQPEEKKCFSQAQSCTLIDDDGLSSAFGFSKSRNTKLYGIITSPQDALITRLMLEDSGTVVRLFDHEDEKSAMSSRAYNAYVKNEFYPIQKLAEFKARNKIARLSSSKTNEVLARLRFNPYRTVVSICSESLEARLLACNFAQELLDHYKAYAVKKGVKVNPHFKIPIIFYIPKSKNNDIDTEKRPKYQVKLYTDEMRKKDREQALQRYQDIRFSQGFKSQDYELLLELPEDAISSLFLEECVILPLQMINKGYVRMLSRLLRVTRNSSVNINDSEKLSVCDEMVRLLVKKDLVKKNDPVISKLICAEEFDLAERFIAATNSDKMSLQLNNADLAQIVIKTGNPRHLSYFGLDTFLLYAANFGSWVVVNLCLKEYPVLSPVLLGSLLVIACRSGELVTAKYLLKMGADTARKDGGSPIMFAVNHELVMLFTDYPTDAEDKSDYGYALLQALSQGDFGVAKLLLQAGAKPNWRRHYKKSYALHSTLWYVIERDDNTLLPQLIEHEKSYHDQFSFARYALALTLAHEKGNQEAVLLLEANFPDVTLIDPANIAVSVCRRVLELLVVGKNQMAEKILLKYCYEYQLLAQPIDQKSSSTRLMMGLFNYRPLAKNHDDFTAALLIIMPYFIEIAQSLSFAYKAIFPPIVKWLLECREPSLFRYITDLSGFDLSEDSLYSQDDFIVNHILQDLTLSTRRLIYNGNIRDSVFKMIFDKLSCDTVSLVQEIVRLNFTMPDTTMFESRPTHMIDFFMNRLEWVVAWKNALDKEFSCALSVESPSKSLLLYELGPTVSEELVVPLFKHAFSNKRMDIVLNLVNNPSYDQQVKEKIALAALESCQSDTEILAMMENNIELTAEHVRKAAIISRKNLLLEFLDRIDKNKYATPEYHWSFYTAFHFYAFGDLVVEKKLIGCLGTTLIRHFTLICLLIALQATATFQSNKERWPNVASFFDENKLSRYIISLFDSHDKVSEYHEKLLSVLNDYFVDVATVPKAEITLNTYKKILGIVKGELGIDAIRFKVGSPLQFQVPNRVYRTMKRLDQLLSKSELPPINMEVEMARASRFEL